MYYDVMGNKHSFSCHIGGRSYADRGDAAKGDIVLYNNKPCMVIRANGSQSLSVVELIMKDGTYL